MEDNFVFKFDQVVLFVLSGKRNEDFPQELRGNRDRHGMNTDLNMIRKWFEEHSRAKEFALELLRVFGTKESEMKMKSFCRLSKPLQVLALKLLKSKVTRDEVEELISTIGTTEKKEEKEAVAV